MTTLIICSYGAWQSSSRFDEGPDEPYFGASGSARDGGLLSSEEGAGDPQTTNLYVGNLSPQVLLTHFTMNLWMLINVCMAS